MGEVKNEVHGVGPSKKSKKNLGSGNLNQQVQDLCDELSRLTAIKDEDTLNEGDVAKAENVRKAVLLRCATSLMRSTKVLLEEY